MDFPAGPVVKNPPANAGDMGSTSGPGRSHMSQGNKAQQSHNYRAHILKSSSSNYGAHTPQPLKPGNPRAHVAQEKPPQ